jgi:prophage regulatory protein
MDARELRLDRILSLKEVARVTNLSRTTIWREQRAGRFPRSFRLSAGRVGWSETAVNAWISEKTGSSSAESGALSMGAGRVV